MKCHRPWQLWKNKNQAREHLSPPTHLNLESSFIQLHKAQKCSSSKKELKLHKTSQTVHSLFRMSLQTTGLVWKRNLNWWQIPQPSQVCWHHYFYSNLEELQTIMNDLNNTTKTVSLHIYLYTLAVSPSFGGSRQHKRNNKNNGGFTPFLQRQHEPPHEFQKDKHVQWLCKRCTQSQDWKQETEVDY